MYHIEILPFHFELYAVVFMIKLSCLLRQCESSIVSKGVHGCHDHGPWLAKVATGGRGSIPVSPSSLIFTYTNIICMHEEMRKEEGKPKNEATTYMYHVSVIAVSVNKEKRQSLNFVCYVVVHTIQPKILLDNPDSECLI